jgi:hypothetical protein
LAAIFPVAAIGYEQVKATKSGVSYVGYVGGYSPKAKVFAVYDWQWKRIGLFSPKKMELIRRSNGLCVA